MTKKKKEKITEKEREDPEFATFMSTFLTLMRRKCKLLRSLQHAVVDLLSLLLTFCSFDVISLRDLLTHITTAQTYLVICLLNHNFMSRL